MARLIDADALIDKMRRMPIFEKTDFDKKMLYVEKSIIDDMPTVDVNNFGCTWIPVTERLPEYEGTYLVFTKSGSVTTARWYPERDVRNYRGDFLYHTEGNFHRNATHWMPLPEPPKEVE